MTCRPVLRETRGAGAIAWPGARRALALEDATLVALKLLSPNAGAAVRLTSWVRGAEPAGVGVALACMPNEATRPPDTASTADAFTAGVAFVETAWPKALNGVRARAGER